MYINPFVAGILFTILSEIACIIVYIILHFRPVGIVHVSKEDIDNDENQDDKSNQ